MWTINNLQSWKTKVKVHEGLKFSPQLADNCRPSQAKTKPRVHHMATLDPEKFSKVAPSTVNCAHLVDALAKAHIISALILVLEHFQDIPWQCNAGPKDCDIQWASQSNTWNIATFHGLMHVNLWYWYEWYGPFNNFLVNLNKKLWTHHQLEIIHPKVFAPTSEVVTFEHLKQFANMLALRHWALAAELSQGALWWCHGSGRSSSSATSRGTEGLVHGRYSTVWGTCFRKMLNHVKPLVYRLFTLNECLENIQESYKSKSMVIWKMGGPFPFEPDEKSETSNDFLSESGISVLTAAASNLMSSQAANWEFKISMLSSKDCTDLSKQWMGWSRV